MLSKLYDHIKLDFREISGEDAN